ncbi:hypothetical protein B0H13DRAFT_2280069 [Mycena leptocephala]|nr:hypothetical protein B0H13DRAFT_2280069 [Mycena leptocephala]
MTHGGVPAGTNIQDNADGHDTAFAVQAIQHWALAYLLTTRRALASKSFDGLSVEDLSLKARLAAGTSSCTSSAAGVHARWPDTAANCLLYAFVSVPFTLTLWNMVLRGSGMEGRTVHISFGDSKRSSTTEKGVSERNGVPEKAEVSPTLPLELERKIFETAALIRPVSIPAMMVEPLLYRTLVFTDSKRLLDGFPFLNQGIFERLVRTKPALLRDTVRNVMVRYERRELYHWNPEPPAQTHSLRSSGAHSLSHGPTIQDLLLHTSHPPGLLYWFDQAANSAPEAPKLHTRLGELPQLTHLSVPSHTGNSDTPILAHLLDACISLRALVALEAPPTPPTEDIAFLAENDVRFVTVWPHDVIADRQRGVLTGIDYWARADKHIAWRLSGEVDFLL